MDLKKITAALLTACFLFVHMGGSVIAIEIEHSHAGELDHGHDINGLHVSFAGNHHEHVPAPVDADEDGQPEDDSPHPSHSHQVSLGLDASTPASMLAGFVIRSVHQDLLLSKKERCPNDPSYEVIKPPQLA